MIQITPHMRILVATAPIDFRRGIDGVARACRQILKVDPFSGTVFVFRNKKSTALKVLIYDGQGFWLCQKRLSEKKFRFWPKPGVESAPSARLAAHELYLLLSNGNPGVAQAAPQWRSIAA